METDLYIDSLKEILSSRKAVNPRYSLRALGRDLDVDAAYLAKILNGKKKTTPKIAFKIVKHLSLDDKQALAFLTPALN